MAGAMRRRQGGVGGFTLTELLVTVTIVGVLSGVGVTNYGVAVQRTRWDAARKLLIDIYDAEWKYFNGEGNGTSFFPAPAASPLVACNPAAAGYVACNNTWRNNLYMVTPGTTAPVIVFISTGPPQAFTVTATYNGTTQTINQDRQFCGGAACSWVRP